MFLFELFINKRAMLRSLGGGQIKKTKTKMAAANLKAVQIIIK